MSMMQKINVSAEFNKFEFSVFLKSLVYPTIYP